jgi:toxin ParE1/3/4
MKVRVARGAITDLDEIWTYIATHASIEAAERVVNLLVRRFAILARNPRIGRARPDIRQNLRSFAVGSYRIYYRHERNRFVHILYVRHAVSVTVMRSR